MTGPEGRQYGTAADRSTFNQVHGDQFILRDGPDTTTTFHPVRSLRADTVSFTGRADQVAILVRDAEASRGVTIYAIDGMPGVGKTTLAIHVGHLLSTRFPDAQFFIELHAHTPGRSPARPEDLLTDLLLATGMTAEQIPESLDERAARWRDRMAGRRFLLILDNAAATDQVAPLIPGASDCLVLVTSRRRLTGLRRTFGASLLPLTVFSEAEATDLYARLRGPAADEAEETATVQIVRLCGYLPLAITILAAGLETANAPGTAEVLTDLETAQDHLSAIDSRLDDQELGVAAAFDLSYQRLPATEQRALRLLSLSLGDDFDTHAAAALVDVSLTDARRLLRGLLTQRLLSQPTSGRFRLHDLIATYSRSRTTGEERTPAVHRLFDYYLHMTARCDPWLPQHSGRRSAAVPPARPLTTPAPAITTRAEAVRWLRVERTSILASLEYARAEQEDERVVELTRSIIALLHMDGPWSQAIHLLDATLDILSGRNDLAGIAWTYGETGVFAQRTGDYRLAAELQENSLRLCRELGDRHGEAAALVEIGILKLLTADFAGAEAAEEQAVIVYHDIGYSRGEAWALAQLGVLRRIAGDWPASEEFQERAAGLLELAGDLYGTAWTSAELGVIRGRWKKYPQATELTERAMSIYRELGDRRGEAYGFNQMASIRICTRDFEHAAGLLDRGLTIFLEFGDRHGEAEAYNIQGALFLKTHRAGEARAAFERAMIIAQEIGNPWERAKALAGTALCGFALGRVDEERFQQAVTMCRQVGATARVEKLLAERGKVRQGLTAGFDDDDWWQ
ncbi:tetratricopeptide repeat protein [Actinoplanes oblitus]|uniref:Tetratricopeptide repeat protein n=1 Tax=Actinoplanes oblitus TaxID=3040509 RepID=A0ABY8W942_9ACTN|nr:tetratricopeptide repeat protein [Actinoplanes oblitus]WIM94012.1 tetratricopeptide repeat protein [Actinoplanes oblitus]